MGKEPAFPGGGRMAQKVVMQLSDRKAKPLCMKCGGSPKIEQEHFVREKMAFGFTEATVISANHSWLRPPFFSGHTSGDQKYISK